MLLDTIMILYIWFKMHHIISLIQYNTLHRLCFRPNCQRVHCSCQWLSATTVLSSVKVWWNMIINKDILSRWAYSQEILILLCSVISLLDFFPFRKKSFMFFIWTKKYFIPVVMVLFKKGFGTNLLLLHV